jgi:hypothetical protein
MRYGVTLTQDSPLQHEDVCPSIQHELEQIERNFIAQSQENTTAQ